MHIEDHQHIKEEVALTSAQLGQPEGREHAGEDVDQLAADGGDQRLFDGEAQRADGEIVCGQQRR